VKRVYREAGLGEYLEESHFIRCAALLKEGFESRGITVSVLF
jgi:hypothetical protein